MYAKEFKIFCAHFVFQSHFLCQQILYFSLILKCSSLPPKMLNQSTSILHRFNIFNEMLKINIVNLRNKREKSHVDYGTRHI